MRANSLRVALGLEPVECLSGNDEGGALIGEGSVLGGTGNHAELFKRRQVLLAGSSHVRVGFDADHSIAVFEEYLSQKSCSAADIDNEVVRRQTTLISQRIHHLR